MGVGESQNSIKKRGEKNGKREFWSHFWKQGKEFQAQEFQGLFIPVGSENSKQSLEQGAEFFPRKMAPGLISIPDFPARSKSMEKWEFGKSFSLFPAIFRGKIPAGFQGFLRVRNSRQFQSRGKSGIASGWTRDPEFPPFPGIFSGTLPWARDLGSPGLVAIEGHLRKLWGHLGQSLGSPGSGDNPRTPGQGLGSHGVRIWSHLESVTLKRTPRKSLGSPGVGGTRGPSRRGWGHPWHGDTRAFGVTWGGGT